ncbi:MAG: TIGR02391 family protein [Sulfuriferula sp.]|nr:TIGR02391 family protein [Sulfuriferula sp.]
MADPWEQFQLVVRRVQSITAARSEPAGGSHPFDDRNIHTRIQSTSKKLFDDGHYASATFEAYKLIDKEVSTLAKVSESGVKLMMKVFNEQSPIIRLTDMSSTSEKDEQEGYKFIFSGAVMAIRNPRGHEYGIRESPTECLDHLSLASLLLRRLENTKK